MASGNYNFASEPQPRTIGASREDVLSNLMYFCLCLSTQTAVFGASPLARLLMCLLFGRQLVLP